MSDKMRIDGIEALGYHGLFEVERENGQPFIVDVELELDLEKAGNSDDLNDSIDYNDVATLVHNEIVGPITVHKPRAPISVPFGDVSITIKRER